MNKQSVPEEPWRSTENMAEMPIVIEKINDTTFEIRCMDECFGDVTTKLLRLLVAFPAEYIGNMYSGDTDKGLLGRKKFHVEKGS